MAKITTPELVRFSYVTLDKPKAAPGATAEKFSIQVIIPKEAKKTMAAIEKAIQDAIKEGTDKYGTKWKAKKLPIRDGDVEKEDEAYKDSYFLSANNEQRPALFDKNVQKIIDPTEIISGDWGKLTLNFYAFNAQGNQGIAVSLNAVQKCKDGEPLGNSVSNGDEFGTFQEEEQY